MSQYRKFFVALLSAATTAVSLGLLPGPADKWIAVAAAFLGVYGVYMVPNETP